MDRVLAPNVKYCRPRSELTAAAPVWATEPAAILANLDATVEDMVIVDHVELHNIAKEIGQAQTSKAEYIVLDERPNQGGKGRTSPHQEFEERMGKRQLEDQEGKHLIYAREIRASCGPEDMTGLIRWISAGMMCAEAGETKSPGARKIKRISTSNQISSTSSARSGVARSQREAARPRWSTNSRKLRDRSDIERLKLQSEVHYSEQEFGK
ncbi:hypothetical protein B0H14DRAFT_2588986 [Mycena olivaceomarginata]|nr:hypothetical protein B0H14DRAFT_2588986 [Mycena olivaceomarginata]